MHLQTCKVLLVISSLTPRCYKKTGENLHFQNLVSCAWKSLLKKWAEKYFYKLQIFLYTISFLCFLISTFSKFFSFFKKNGDSGHHISIMHGMFSTKLPYVAHITIWNQLNAKHQQHKKIDRLRIVFLCIWVIRFHFPVQQPLFRPFALIRIFLGCAFIWFSNKVVWMFCRLEAKKAQDLVDFRNRFIN